ncbi:MAG: hypothetical protein IKP88_03705 [Lachnospiraceae bacterium]|nr:hypothetical protein [Lachnospiraceae bacterium]
MILRRSYTILLTLIIAFSASSCNNSGSVAKADEKVGTFEAKNSVEETVYNSLPSVILIDGDCYIATDKTDEDFSDFILGKVAAFIGNDKMPENTSETNFKPYVGCQYAKKNGKYYLNYENSWHELFSLSKEERDSVAANPGSREMPIEEAYDTGKTVQLNGKEYTVYKVDYNDTFKKLYYNIYEDFDSLYKDSDLVVTGKFIDDAVKETVSIYDIADCRYKEYRGASYNTFEIDRVLKGDCNSGTIKIKQNDFIDEDNKRIITYSELTPMIKNGEWIYFLKSAENTEFYYMAGDYTCRYPVRPDITEEKILSDGVSKEELGVYDEAIFRSVLPIYNRIIKEGFIS